jgi:sec-independent protein translocase protein TatB
MFGVGTQELLVILVIALVVVGPQKLPELARAIGRGMRELRKMQDEVTDMVRVDLNPDPPTVHEPGVSGPKRATPTGETSETPRSKRPTPPHRTPRPGGVARMKDGRDDDGAAGPTDRTATAKAVAPPQADGDEPQAVEADAAEANPPSADATPLAAEGRRVPDEHDRHRADASDTG